MSRPLYGLVLLMFPAAFLAASTAWGQAQRPSAAAALKLRPVQDDVEYDSPSEADLEKCELKAESSPRGTGWVVYGPNGELLRRFVDTNGDNKVDLWCYYKGGLEVYRDIDSDFNGKADQYRWLGAAGLRWGIDDDEDGRIDRWQAISAEEATAEVVAAFRARDARRFQALLLTADELKQLGLSDDDTAEITKKITAAREGFATLADTQKLIAPEAKWLSFGAQRPGVIPAGAGGSTKDVVVYDNAAAVIEQGGQHAQVAIGTLVRVGDGWRVIDTPSNLLDAQAATSGFFFNASLVRRGDAAPMVEGLSSEAQKLIAEMQQVDEALAKATAAADGEKLHLRRAELLEQLAAQAQGDDRAAWLKQLADTLSAGVQTGAFAAGEARLAQAYEKLAAEDPQGDLTGYLKFRLMTSAYTRQVQAPDADFAKTQEQWLKNLEEYVTHFPKTEDTPEAMLQLAIAQEFAGEDEAAARWFGRIVSEFPESLRAQKAAGAKRRLESVGKPLALKGATVDGRQFDLAAYRGKHVVIHYWATWCEPCKQDLETLKNLQAKYAARGLALVGVSLDSERDTVATYLRTTRLPWPQLFEPGGLDSRLANELGVLTLPTMLLIDDQGRVVSRNIHTSELDAELSKRLK